MSLEHPGEYPTTLEEELEALRSIREEDIDYSDIPPMSDNVIITPFREIRRRRQEMRNAQKASAL